ncbi:MAG: trifunctional histidinol dehydrogenase [Piccolia ochrophora]|nr:MAG: trifunctional histidinol dehydrogenase [Piccolia ochrophora]
MVLPFIPALERPSLNLGHQSGLDLQTLSYLGGVFVRVDPLSLDNAFKLLEEISSTFGVRFSVHYDVSSLTSTEHIISLLNAGAAKVFVSFEQLQHLEKIETIDLDRLVMTMPAARQETKAHIIEAIGDTSVGIFADCPKDPELLKAWLKEYGNDRPPVYFALNQQGSPPDLQSFQELMDLSAIPILPASDLTVDDRVQPGLLPLRSILKVKSDRPDGLFTTLVTDERGTALGLVYSSLDSIQESLKTGRGVYHSRKRGLWYKGDSSGDIQELVSIETDCDEDCLKFTVRQKGRGFCHLANATCFGPYRGLSRLQQTLKSRKASAPADSYTARLFASSQLLRAKIMEEANELCDATTKEDVAFEAADLIYFAMTKCIGAGVSLEEIERNLDLKSTRVKRRKGDAKGPWAGKGTSNSSAEADTQPEVVKEAASVPKSSNDDAGKLSGQILMQRYFTSSTAPETIKAALQRPSQRSTEKIMNIVTPIINMVRERGDTALLEYTHKFEKATSLTSPVLRAPFPQALMQLPPETAEAIDVSFENIRRFHAAQKEGEILSVETMPGVVCSRFSRPIERVGLYIPGGTAVLPSTALMLGVPALVAGCKKIVLASPPRPDGSITPEIVYIAQKVGAESIVLAGGAQAVAALAYGTESVSKVDKILGPGNQFVTAAKMLVSNDTNAGVSIDMPAGPSEVLVIADGSANPGFVASDLLSQAEHGVDSQVVLIGVALTETQIGAIEWELHTQASALPRVDIVRGAIEHSVTLIANDMSEAMTLSNHYAPEHLILQVEDAANVAGLVENAGSVFVGPWTPESVGDYSAGVNHSLPTYGYARQYSGVNLGSYLKHITSSTLTAQGLRNLGGTVMQLAKVEELEAHRRAVEIRLKELDRMG